MKHFRLRSDVLGVPVCSVVLAFALQSALGPDNAPTAFAQSPTKQPTQPRPQKVANPLNDLLDEAQRNIDSNNFESALAPLQKFIAEKPDVAFAHFQLGYAYTALKRSDEARAEYERAIALDAKMPEAHLNLGILLLNSQQYAAAVTPLTKALELLPAQSRPRSLLAVAQDRSGDQEAAARSFEGVLHLAPNDLTANRYLRDLDLRRGKPAEADARLCHALEISPDAPATLP